VEYECPVAGCSGKLLVTSRGHAEKVPEPPKRILRAEPVAPPATKKRRAPTSAALPPPASKSARTAASKSGGVRVRICKEDYTSLSWFLNNPDPSKKQTRQARANCHEGAVELSGGHVRALTGTAYAKTPPGRPKPLCLVRNGCERERLGDEKVDTEVTGLQIQRAKGKLVKRLSQVLFRVDVLEQAFSSYGIG